MDNLLLVVMQSAHLVTQRKAFQLSMEEILTLSREQTSSQPLIVCALEQLKVMQTNPRKTNYVLWSQFVFSDISADVYLFSDYHWSFWRPTFILYQAGVSVCVT